MAKKKPFSSRTNKFRAQAELLLRESARQISRLPVADLHTMAHELHVHQMELEMQNEELRRVQLELETSRDRFSTLYDFSPVGFVNLDDGGAICEANLTMAGQLDIERPKLLGQKFTHFIAPEAQDIFHLHLQAMRRAGNRHICELKLVRSNGTSFMGRLESIVVQEGRRGGQHFLMAVSDMTEQLRSEATRANLAAIVESSNDAIISHSLEGTITTWNKGAERILGYTSRWIIGRPIFDLIPPEAREEARKIREKIGLGEEVVPFEAVRIAQSGRRITVSITASPIKDSHGGILGVSMIVRDVTRQKQVDEALRQSEQNLVDFFNEAPLGLLWVRSNGTILRMNRAQLEFLGCEAEEALNRPILDFMADEDVAKDLLARLAGGEIVKNYRAQFRIKDRSLKHTLIDANGLWKGRRLAHSRWFVRDITRRMELEREILAISEREKRRIGQDLHDELGQQLAGIEFVAQSLAGRLSALSPAAGAQAEEITRMVQRAMVHTRELAHGLSPIGLETDGLVPALRELAGSTKRIFRIDCRFRCKKQVMIQDHSVGIHLYRIAQEAVSNAIKHGKARRVDIGLTAYGDRIVLAVSDDGIGIPKHFKSDKTKGMGLRVMRYRAGVLGGSLIAQRQPNGGMTFVCSIKNYPSPGKKNPHHEKS